MLLKFSYEEVLLKGGGGKCNIDGKVMYGGSARPGLIDGGAANRDNIDTVAP